MSQEGSFKQGGGSGGNPINAIEVDAFTPPGTNPVVPDGTNKITVTGGQVAAGTTSNVIRTDSLSANTFTIEVQRSQAVSSSTVGDNGVSHFNSVLFTVDSNGFVSLSGSNSGLIWQIISLSQVAQVGAGYLINVGSTVTLTLPSAPTIGQVFAAYALNGATWIIQCGLGQQVQVNNQITTMGGTVTSTKTGDYIFVMAVTTTSFVAIPFSGNFLVA